MQANKSFSASYHEGLKKWVEIGNSGMFRPEMLRPMGLPEDVQVIAWGLSLERYVCSYPPVYSGTLLTRQDLCSYHLLAALP